MTAIDFFCGAGGLTRGLRNVGIDVVAGVDANGGCKLSYEKNNASSVFVQADLKKLTREALADRIGHVPNHELIFTGCAPCQPFSSQRRQISRDGSTLLTHFGRLVREFLPGFVVIENVPGIARVKGNSAYRNFLRSLTTLGYKYAVGLVDAKWYGVPQSRVRWVVVASTCIQPSLPERTHGPRLRKYATVRQAIAHFPRIDAGAECETIPNHRAAKVMEINLARLRATPHNGGSRSDWPEEFVLDCHRNYKGHPDVYGRLRWDAPAPTLTCRCYSISNGRYAHPEQDRAISLREAASLQSFPEDYTFYGKSQSEIGAQIGNAVPVKLGEALGRKLTELHEQFLRERQRN
ncbi:MAG TPA: DNA cytosine methyltransferase [Verrucomicrobiae bacterium]|nr:DNA cytosine methyltransferase [Verrucomicrobiae bacterium]